MTDLSSLKNTHRPRKKVQRVGRGIGSKRGKTCCRGGKGDSARRGYKCRFGNEGGQLPLYRKLPIRGFPNARFELKVHAVNLGLIDTLYADGEIVSLETLKAKRIIPQAAKGILKILSNGDLTKKVSIEAHAFSSAAIAKLEKGKIAHKRLPLSSGE
jgi:large subunit ribosomal protein L15